jgi:hypothetical protein
MVGLQVSDIDVVLGDPQIGMYVARTFVFD